MLLRISATPGVPECGCIRGVSGKPSASCHWHLCRVPGSVSGQEPAEPASDDLGIARHGGYSCIRTDLNAPMDSMTQEIVPLMHYVMTMTTNMTMAVVLNIEGGLLGGLEPCSVLPFAKTALQHRRSEKQHWLQNHPMGNPKAGTHTRSHAITNARRQDGRQAVHM